MEKIQTTNKVATEKTFFSYARADSAFVLKLAKDLRDAGVSIWLDQLDIKGGNLWDTAIEAALNAASNVIVVLSTASVKSHNVMDEVSFALESGKKVIPILLNECNVPFRLRRLQRIDFTGDYQSALNQLLEVLNQTPVSASINFSEEETKETIDQVNERSAVLSGNQSSATGNGPTSKEEAQPRETKEAQNHQQGNKVLPEKAEFNQKQNSRTIRSAYRKYFLIGAIVIIAGLALWAMDFFESPAGNNVTGEDIAADTSQQPSPAKEPVSIPVPDDLKIGDRFMGGVVLYFYFSEEKHGLLVAPEDYNVQSTSSDSINFCKDLQTEITYYKTDGFDGWRLPTLEELRRIYEERKNIDGLNLNEMRYKNKIPLYASVPDLNCLTASKNFKTGVEIFGVLNKQLNYRLVRSF